MAVIIDGTNGITAPPQLKITAGTAAANTAPIDLTAGTNLTTAAPGSVEYDGSAWYFTPSGTQRGVVPAAQYYRLGSLLTLSNVSPAENIYGVGATLSSATVYEFEGMFQLQTSGTTSHTENIGLGGTVTSNSTVYSVVRFTNSTTATAPISALLTSNTATAVTTAITTAQNVTYMLKGTISANVGGTFAPTITFSAAPAGVSNVAIGSFFKISPVAPASLANSSVGTWA